MENPPVLSPLPPPPGRRGSRGDPDKYWTMYRSSSSGSGSSDSPPPTAPKTNDEKLLDLTNSTMYSLVQRNGQRIYGGPPPGWTEPAPEKGCEVFVGKVPRDCYEDELVPIFAQIGRIYELRLMMDFSGSNRGYFFVRYTNREDAKKAVKQLNNYEIRPGKFLGVIQSVDNRKLWISGIPKNRSAAEIKSEMERITDGVRDVILYQSQTDKSKTRGYAFVEYESHRAAALARRKLVPGRIFLLGQEIEKVDWAEPENEVDEEIMNKVKILFIRNLMAATTEDQIRKVFEELSGNKVERVKKSKDYAFVHLLTREAAELAMQRARAGGLCIDGSEIEVTWSKPVDKNIYNTRKTLTKILTQGNGAGGGVGMLGGPPGMGMFDSPLSQLNPLPALPGFPGGVPFNRGAPGTAPPRRLVKMSGLANGSGGMNGTIGQGRGGGNSSGHHGHHFLNGSAGGHHHHHDYPPFGPPLPYSPTFPLHHSAPSFYPGLPGGPAFDRMLASSGGGCSGITTPPGFMHATPVSHATINTPLNLQDLAAAMGSMSLDPTGSAAFY